MWTPESVSTVCDISPTFKAKAASSNGFCIVPLWKGPRSPPLLADEQSEYFWARSTNVDLPVSISSRYAEIEILICKKNGKLHFESISWLF